MSRYALAAQNRDGPTLLVRSVYRLSPGRTAIVWSVMSDPLGLSIGTTNLVAARVGNQPVIRRSVLTLADGTLLTGFVERVGDSVPLVAPDGSTHHADRLLVDALGAILQASGGQPVPEITIAVPAYWGMTTLRTLRTALRASPDLAANGTPARLVSDAVASLTALHANLGLPSQGVVALLDFGGGGTSITLTDAGAAFEPIDESTRYHRVRRRSDRPGAARPHRRRHRGDGRYRSCRHRRGGIAAPGCERNAVVPRSGCPSIPRPRSPPNCPVTGRRSVWRERSWSR